MSLTSHSRARPLSHFFIIAAQHNFPFFKTNIYKEQRKHPATHFKIFTSGRLNFGSRTLPKGIPVEVLQKGQTHSRRI